MHFRASRLTVITLLLTLSAMRVRAQATAAATPALDPSIETVITRGQWSANGASGSYRIVVLVSGWEEVSHRVIVQWLEEDQAARTTVVRAAVDLGSILPEAYSLTDPIVRKQGTAWVLSIRSSDRPLARPNGTAVLVLGPPGRVRRLRPR